MLAQSRKAPLQRAEKHPFATASFCLDGGFYLCLGGINGEKQPTLGRLLDGRRSMP